MVKDNILVVDDEKTILELARRFLVAEGYQVEVAPQANQAIQMLENGEFNILLTDIRMPGMSGLELMKVAKSLQPDIVMIVITGHGTITTAIESLKVGAMGFILKPFTRQEMTTAIQNATEKHRLREENVRMKSLMPLFQFSQNLMLQTDLNQLLNFIVELVRKELKVDRVTLMLLSDQSSELVVKATTGFDTLDETKLKKRPGAGIAGMAFEKKEPIMIQGGMEQNPHLRDMLEDERVSSGLAVPIIIRKKVIGVLSLSKFSQGHPFGESDLELISIFCGQVAVAIENARLYRAIKNSYLRTLQALVAAIEIKDAFSKGHSSGVSRYATLLGQKLDLSKTQIRDLAIASILHDIGKLGSSDDILKKESKLSPDEFESMKAHPGNAVKILESIGLAPEVLSSILHHHEWWDGGGYPKGLSGESIPLYARIIAIADTIDSMMTSRPYREKLEFTEVKKELERYSGKQFDPRLVETLLNMDGALFLGPSLPEPIDFSE